MSCCSAFPDLINDSLVYLQDLKIILQRLQLQPTDTASASGIPCATSAIKEMANLHGCKHIVAFFFVFEKELDRVRNAELRAEADLITLLLSCCDHITTMVKQLAACEFTYLGHYKKSHELIRRLRAYHEDKIKYATAA